MDRRGMAENQLLRIIASRSGALAALASLLLGCGGDPAPPSVRVQIDTDAPLRFVDRLRVEVYSREGNGAPMPVEDRDYDRRDDGDSRDDAPTEPAEQEADPITAAAYSTALPLILELTPSERGPEALVRVRGFSKRKLIPVDEARLDPAPLRDDPDGCEAGALGLNVGSTVELAPGADERPNTEGLSCDGRTPVTLQPMQVLVDEAGPYFLSATSDQVVLFAIDRCGTDQSRFRCSTEGLRFTLEEADLRNPPVVLAGTIGGPRENARLKLERTDPLPNLNPPASQGPGDSLDTPAPEVTIDRVARIDLTKEGSTVNLTLHASCFGIRADLLAPRSCVDGAELLDLELEAPAEVIARRRVPEWAAASSRGCTSSAGPEGAVCVSGGAFVLGDVDQNEGLVEDERAAPERIVTVDPFYLDAREYNLGRLARSTSLGVRFDPNQVLPAADASDACLRPALPGNFVDRSLPLTCVNWAAARALCQAAGGDLPTSVQWEYAAATAGSYTETTYPWGNQIQQFAERLGPDPTESNLYGLGEDASADCTPSQTGICDLATNVSEWTLDSHAALSSECWRRAPAENPTCRETLNPLRTVKGGSWRRLGPQATRAAARRGEDASALKDDLGFRCAYPEAIVRAPLGANAPSAPSVFSQNMLRNSQLQTQNGEGRK